MTVQKPLNTKRIIVLGDSFTFGIGLATHETFLYHLQSFFGFNSKYEVINAGYHAGNSTDSYYAYLAKEGILLSPDLLIVVLYSGNDVEDIGNHIWAKKDKNGLPIKVKTIRNSLDYKHGYMVLADKDRIPWNYKIPFLKNSNLFIGFTNTINRFVLPGEYKFLTNLRKGRFGKRLPSEKALGRFKSTVNGIQSFADNNGIDCIFFVIPPAKSYPTNSSYQKYLFKHKTMLKELSKIKTIAYYDTKSHLTQSDYFKHDAHLNPKGSFKLGKLIWDVTDLPAILVPLSE